MRGWLFPALFALLVPAWAAAAAPVCPAAPAAVSRLSSLMADDGTNAEALLVSLKGDVSACRPGLATRRAVAVRAMAAYDRDSASDAANRAIDVAFAAVAGLPTEELRTQVFWRAAEAGVIDGVDRALAVDGALRLLKFDWSSPSMETAAQLRAAIFLAGENDAFCRRYASYVLDHQATWAQGLPDERATLRADAVAAVADCAIDIRDHDLHRRALDAYLRLYLAVFAPAQAEGPFENFARLSARAADPTQLLGLIGHPSTAVLAESKPRAVAQAVAIAAAALAAEGQRDAATSLHARYCLQGPLFGEAACLITGEVLDYAAGSPGAAGPVRLRYADRRVARAAGAIQLAPIVLLVASDTGDIETLKAAQLARRATWGPSYDALVGCRTIEAALANPARLDVPDTVKTYGSAMSRASLMSPALQERYLACLDHIAADFVDLRGGAKAAWLQMAEALSMLGDRPPDERLALRLRAYRTLALADQRAPVLPEENTLARAEEDARWRARLITVRGLAKAALAPQPPPRLAAARQEILVLAAQVELVLSQRTDTGADELRAFWAALPPADVAAFPADLRGLVDEALAPAQAPAGYHPGQDTDADLEGDVSALEAFVGSAAYDLPGERLARFAAEAGLGPAAKAQLMASRLAKARVLRVRAEKAGEASFFFATKACTIDFVRVAEALLTPVGPAENTRINRLAAGLAFGLMQQEVIPARSGRTTVEALEDLRAASGALAEGGRVADAWAAWRLVGTLRDRLPVFRDACPEKSATRLMVGATAPPDGVRALLGTEAVSTPEERVALLATALDRRAALTSLGRGGGFAGDLTADIMRRRDQALRLLDVNAYLLAQRDGAAAMTAHFGNRAGAGRSVETSEPAAALGALVKSLGPTDAVLYLEDGFSGPSGAFSQVGVITSDHGLVVRRITTDRARIRGMVEALDVAGAASREALRPFDLQFAYQLYARTIGSQAVDLSHKTRFYVIARGTFAELPLGVLVTQPPQPAVRGPGASYADVSWFAGAAQLAYLNATPFPAASGAARARPGRGLALVAPAYGAREAGVAAVASPGAVAGLGAKPRPPAAIQVAVRATTCGLEPIPGFDAGRIAASPGLDVRSDEGATESFLKAQSRSGALARLDLLLFLTHGQPSRAGRVVPTSIALAPTPGCDAPGNSVPEDDGFLNPEEAEQLRLDADWVILAGCLTGKTGLASLQDAFIRAGARSVLVSPTSVPADSTAELVRRLLAAPREAPVAEATAAALAAIRTDPRWTHPAYWGSWMTSVRADAWGTALTGAPSRGAPGQDSPSTSDRFPPT